MPNAGQYIQIKASEAERADLTRRAKAAGMTLSVYGHMLLFGHDERLVQLEAQVARMAADLAALKAAMSEREKEATE